MPTADLTMEVSGGVVAGVWTVIVTVYVREDDVVRLARADECAVNCADVDEATGGIVHWQSGYKSTDGYGKVSHAGLSGGPIWPYAWNRWAIFAKHLGTGKEVRKEIYFEDGTYFL